MNNFFKKFFSRTKIKKMYLIRMIDDPEMYKHEMRGVLFDLREKHASKIFTEKEADKCLKKNPGWEKVLV